MQESVWGRLCCNMRILVTGKNGQLVSALEAEFRGSFYETVKIGRPEVDFANPMQLHSKIIAIKPDLLISAAAFTAVDDAEGQSLIADNVNHKAPAIMASACNELSIPIIHISTEFVFSGDKKIPYTESDATGPINQYGRSKLAGEIAIADKAKNHVILRTSWVFSEIGNNFVKSILQVGLNRETINIVSDQIGCPNNAHDLATAIVKISDRILKDKNRNLRGIFHFSGQNFVSRSEFAKKIYDAAKRFGYQSPVVHEIGSAQFPLPAKRPKNSSLNCQKLKEIYDIEINDWETNLNNCVEKILIEMGEL